MAERVGDEAGDRVHRECRADGEHEIGGLGERDARVQDAGVEGLLEQDHRRPGDAVAVRAARVVLAGVDAGDHGGHGSGGAAVLATPGARALPWISCSRPGEVPASRCRPSVFWVTTPA